MHNCTCQIGETHKISCGWLLGVSACVNRGTIGFLRAEKELAAVIKVSKNKRQRLCAVCAVGQHANKQWSRDDVRASDAQHRCNYSLLHVPWIMSVGHVHAPACQQKTNIESSPVWDTSRIEASYKCGHKSVQPGRKCPKSVIIQYLQACDAVQEHAWTCIHLTVPIQYENTLVCVVLC